MNNNGKIKELKPSCLIFDKNNTSYFGFDDTKICIISQGFEYLNNVNYIVETISNKTFTVRATYQNTKIVCVGFLSYYILYKNCTDIPLSTIANNYYNTSLNEYSKDKMDINKAKDEYPTIHLSQEKVFFEYAQKNFFPLLPKCDVNELTIKVDEYFFFIEELSKKHLPNKIENKNELILKYNAFATSIQPYIETRIDGTIIKHIIKQHELPIGISPLKFNEKDKFINIWYFIDIFKIPIKNMKIITNEHLKHNQKSSKFHNDFAKICTTFKKGID
ncbi:MAG: hypothetical protein PHH25_08680 [Bacteroidales bacterium]|nr:hypothetical protein [Bacteroidales bacterium]MDD4582427.1 hypothetical protein [Bacteroidales bacterium]